MQITIQGTVDANGALELDEKVPIPAGRVLVTVQPVVNPPKDDPFWESLERIWKKQKIRGHVPRSDQEIEAQRQALDTAMEKEIQDAIRLQVECRQRRANADAKENAE